MTSNLQEAKHKQRRLYLWLCICLAGSSTKATPDTSEADKAAAQANDACKTLHYIKALATGLSTAKAQASSAVEKLQRQATAAQLESAAATGHKDKLAWTAVAAIALTKHSAAASALEASSMALDEAKVELAKFHAAVAAAQRMQQRKHKAYGTIATGQGVPAKASDADFSCTYSDRLTEVAHDNCPEPSGYHADLKKNSYEAKGTTTLPVPNRLFFEQLKATVTGYSKGGHNVAVVPQNTHGRCADAAGTATSLGGTSGLGVQIEFTAEAPGVTTTSIYSNKDSKTCVQKPEKLITHEDRIAQLQAVVCAAVKDLPQKPKDLETYTVTDLKTDSDMANIAKAILQGRSASKLDDSKMNQAAVDKVIIELFGTADNSFSENYIKKLKSQKLTFRTAGEQREESAITAIEANTIGQALVYYTAKSALTAALQQTEKPGQIASNNECKGVNDSEKCNKKDGCEFKDGECKAKEGVKSENDAKNTNTTGSNSFVINKTPLLLAALLF